METYVVLFLMRPFLRQGHGLEHAVVDTSEEFGELVRRRADVLTRGQRRVADYIARHFDECAFQTSADIGKKAGVSEATVFRLSTTLGFRRFSGLQKFIRSGLVEQQNRRAAKPLKGIEDESAILAQVAQFDAENVHQTMSQTSAAILPQGRRVDPGCPGNLHDRHALICGDRILSDRSPQSVVWKRDAPLSLGL